MKGYEIFRNKDKGQRGFAPITCQISSQLYID